LNPSQSYKASTAIQGRTAATRKKWTRPKLLTGRPVLDLFTPEGWKAKLTSAVGAIPSWFTSLHADSHPSK